MLGVCPLGPRSPRLSDVGLSTAIPWSSPDDLARERGRARVREGRRATAPTEALAVERRAWIVLATVEGVGPRTLARLVAAFGSATRALEIAAAGRLRPQLAPSHGERAFSLPAPVLVGIVAAARDQGGRIAELVDARVWTITLLDPDYPRGLLDLADPPPVVFGQGLPSALALPRAVAVVGTRGPTPIGRVVASQAAAGLCSFGAAIVSGLALGIDGAAHAAALESGGTTIAVIGAGHREPGPRTHRALYRRILDAGGAVVGELSPGVRASRGTFPRRNRLIAALSDAVVVAEAPLRSGALITARLALELGRPVFLAPDRGVPATAGCGALLADAPALAWESPAALAARLGWDELPRPVPAPRPAPFDDLGPGERRIAEELARGPVTADALVLRTGLAPGVVSGLLTLLQLRGMAHTLGALYLPAGPLLRPW